MSERPFLMDWMEKAIIKLKQKGYPPERMLEYGITNRQNSEGLVQSTLKLRLWARLLGKDNPKSKTYMKLMALADEMEMSQMGIGEQVGYRTQYLEGVSRMERTKEENG